MATLPKWTDERTDELKSFVGGESQYLKILLQEQQSSLRLLHGQFLAS